MVCEIAHLGYNGATCGILIQWQLSTSIRKLSPIHFCTYDNNHTSSFLTLLPHFIAETQIYLQALSLLTVHNARISSDYTKNYFGSPIPQILPSSERVR